MIPNIIKNSLLEKQKGLSEITVKAIKSINKNKKKPLGKFSPWAWCLEPVRGCNLACWHCPARLFPKGYKFMSKETWINVWKIIKEVTPYCRVEMANSGEPTLHPDFLEFISIARQISPHSQIQITTNGTTLIKKKITYQQLFTAGVNIVYVDMYAPKEKHISLAEKSGYNFYEYYKKSDNNRPSAWTYHNDQKIQFIALSETPDNWPAQKINKGGLGTFLNNIDFEEAKKFNIFPIIDAPIRRCNQPMKYVQVVADGTYLFCCQDVFNTAKITQNVNGGIEDFIKFWLGGYIQYTRKTLFEKNRRGHPICKNCGIIFSRCDMKLWKEDMFSVIYKNPIRENDF